jgi:hypothetical protein
MKAWYCQQLKFLALLNPSWVVFSRGPINETEAALALFPQKRCGQAEKQKKSFRVGRGLYYT